MPAFVDVAGLRLRYLDVGPTSAADTDALPLLVIPGHTARIEGFDEMVPRLAERHRVLVVDLPGSGESEKPERRYDLTFYEDVIVAFLDHLGVAQAVPVGGSLGGNLVLRLGHRFPDRFPMLTLWAPGGAWKAKPRLAALMRRVCGRRLFWPSVRIQSRYWYARDFAGRQQGLDDTFAYYRRVMSPGFVAMYWGIAADQIGQSLFDIGPSITQPSLLMWGDQDHGAGMGKGVAHLHDLIPGSELVVFPGRRHSLEAEIPSELATAIVGFVEANAPETGR
ncbi:MAG: putative hydrolase [Acidimicrobiales bacterium]|nr:putative hydrolase [Acidimicrobiales bacterium]